MSGAILLHPPYVFMGLTGTNLVCNSDEMRTEYLKHMCFVRSIVVMTSHCSAWNLTGEGFILLSDTLLPFL
jgi:hypothetical protein